MWGFCGAVLFCGLLVMYPAQCRLWAGEAIVDWAINVTPSLFPFLMVLPYLCTEEARGVYRALLGWLPRLFGLPGEAAGPMAVGMLAGSPAGAAAVSRSAGGMTRSQTLRLSVLASGAGPAFYVSFVGGALLGDGGAARRMWLCQCLAAGAAAWMAGACVRDGERTETEASKTGWTHPVTRAAGQMLVIGGFMTLFSVAGGALCRYLGEEYRPFIMAALEMTGGARAVAGASMAAEWKRALLGAACAFGGASICAQCMAELKKAGVRTGEYVCAKLIHGIVDFWLILGAERVQKLFSIGG